MNALIQPQLAKETDGLLAIAKGLPLNFADDPEMLRACVVGYDARCAGMPLRKVACSLGRK